MRLSDETKFFLGIIAFTIAIVVGAMFFFSQPPKPVSKDTLIALYSPTLGEASASHYLVEFSDFQCPACKTFATEVENLASLYKDKLQIAYRFFPLPQHAYAKPAAYAAIAAGNQGKFWEMSSQLFISQDALSDQTVASIASSLNLDMVKFDADRKSPETAKIIDDDVAFGNSIGINSTPTFYLDGIKLDLATPKDLSDKVTQVLK